MRALALRIAAAAALVAGCGQDTSGPPAPLDALAYPTSLAMAGSDLLVVSSNFDLAFDAGRGGSLLRVDPEASLGGGLDVRGGQRIPSFGGEVVFTDGVACGLPSPTAFVTSRYTSALYRLGLPPDGGVVCGEDCETPFPIQMRDTYALALACDDTGQRLFVGHLRTTASRGWLTAVDLTGGEEQHVSVDTGLGPISSIAYDPTSRRLFFAAGVVPGTSPIRYLSLAGGCEFGGVVGAGGCVQREFDLATVFRGADIRDLVLSHPQPGRARRLYVLARLYDADFAALIGGIPTSDIGGAVIILELREAAAGGLDFSYAGSYSIGSGAGQLRLLPPRPGQGDVLVATAAQEGRVYVIDEQTGAALALVGRDDVTGAPLVGRTPFGLAVGPVPDDPTRAYVYVSSFLDAFVSRIEVPLATPSAAFLELGPGGGPRRIGQESP